jgi:hypothetical protein
MQYLKYWWVAKGGTCLVIHDEVIQGFEEFAQTYFGSLKAGGILLAISVDLVSKSLRHQSRRVGVSTRAVSLAGALAVTTSWRDVAGETDALIQYIGEWHTCAEDFPTQSLSTGQGERNAQASAKTKGPSWLSWLGVRPFTLNL